MSQDAGVCGGRPPVLLEFNSNGGESDWRVASPAHGCWPPWSNLGADALAWEEQRLPEHSPEAVLQVVVDVIGEEALRRKQSASGGTCGGIGVVSTRYRSGRYHRCLAAYFPSSSGVKFPWAASWRRRSACHVLVQLNGRLPPWRNAISTVSRPQLTCSMYTCR